MPGGLYWNQATEEEQTWTTIPILAVLRGLPPKHTAYIEEMSPSPHHDSRIGWVVTGPDSGTYSPFGYTIEQAKAKIADSLIRRGVITEAQREAVLQPTAPPQLTLI